PVDPRSQRELPRRRRPGADLRRGQDPAPWPHDRLWRGQRHPRRRQAVRRRPRHVHDRFPIGAPMNVLYTPNLIAPSITDGPRAQILAAAGPGSRIVDAKDTATQRAEIADTDMIFGRVPNEVFVLGKRVRYYHSIGAGVDAILTQDLVESDVILASEKG